MFLSKTGFGEMGRERPARQFYRAEGCVTTTWVVPAHFTVFWSTNTVAKLFPINALLNINVTTPVTQNVTKLHLPTHGFPATEYGVVSFNEVLGELSRGHSYLAEISQFILKLRATLVPGCSQ